MGKQRQDKASGESNKPIFSSLIPSLSGKAGGGGKGGGPFWNKLPRILGMGRIRLQMDAYNEVLDYEPIHLHINPIEVHPMDFSQLPNDPLAGLFDKDDAESAETEYVPGKPMANAMQKLALENFRFLMDQVPAVRTIEFSGRQHDPLENPDLSKMIDYAHRFNGAESTVYTNGLLLGSFTDELLKSRLHRLVIQIHAHRPSLYALMANQPLSQFMEILENIRYLMARKRELKSPLEIELSMSVDIHNYRQIPEMIRFAEELGVDGIRLDNYLGEDPAVRSDRTLYRSQQNVVKFLESVWQKELSNGRLIVTLPILLDTDMSNHRHCLEAYGTVSVDAEFNVSACSRQLLPLPSPSKIWEEDFFNNNMYKWLRTIHSCGQTVDCKTDVPMPCQGCPRNIAIQNVGQ